MAINRSGNREMFDDDPEMIRQFQMDELDNGSVEAQPVGEMQHRPNEGAMMRTQPARMAGGDRSSQTVYDVLDGMGSNPNYINDTLDAQKASGVEKPKMTPAGGMAGGAMARYGTGNIEGAENIGSGGHMGALTGFNTGGWGTQERGTNSIKNTFGKIASRYDPTQQGAVRQILADPEFAQFFPEATLVEHPKGDLIDFGDGNPVDVLRNAVEGGSGDAWQFLVGGGQGAPMDAGMGSGGDLASLMGGLGDDPDALAQILASLQQLSSGQETNPFRQAVLSELDPEEELRTQV